MQYLLNKFPYTSVCTGSSYLGNILRIHFMGGTMMTQENLPAQPPSQKSSFSVKQWLFDFKGRTGRVGFWIYWLCMWAVDLILFSILFGLVLEATPGASDSTNDGYGWLAMFIALPVVIVADFVLLAAPRARRLHDQGISGCIQFIWFFPYRGPLVLCIILALPGEKKENRFGPPLS